MNLPTSRERRAPARPEHPEDPSPQNPSKGWYSRGYLPHFDSQSVWQSITFRLADSLPQNKLLLHVLLNPFVSVGKIVQSWKSYTGRWALTHNAELGLGVPGKTFAQKKIDLFKQLAGKDKIKKTWTNAENAHR